jgi:hypothetical protein
MSDKDPIIEAMAAETQAALALRDKQAEDAKVYQLAFWPDDERAMPGDFIACALFTASKSTSYVTRCELASINGLTVIFTGKRLTQVHADVWMGVMHLAREQFEGDVVTFRGRRLLELIGRHTHQGQREQLKDWLSQLTATDVLIQSDGKKKRFGGSLLPWREERDVVDGQTVYTVDISRELAKVLSGNYWRVDWDTRKQLQNKPLALWLQTYFSRFTRPVKVAQLHALSGSSAPLKKFRQNLKRALDDLHAAGGYSAAIDAADTVVAVKRPPPKPRRPLHEGQEVLPFLRVVK